MNEYLRAGAVLLGAVLALWLFQKYVLWRVKKIAEKTKTDIDDAIVELIATIKPPFYWFLAVYIAFRTLRIEGLPARVVNGILLIWATYQVVIALQMIVDYIVRRKLAARNEREVKAVREMVKTMSGIVLWTLGALFVLQNLGVQVTSLLAGLGVGGIAVAFAAQRVLGDLFSSLAIYLDKPFVPGDFVVFGDVKGTVQQVGIKTTRLKALDGEEIVVPNQKITDGQLKNYGRMKERRVALDVGVTYETPNEKMNHIPEILKDAIESAEGVRFNRAHFKHFAESALVFEAVYHVEDKSFDVHMDVKQEILLKIKEQFEQEGISFAYPTRVVYVKQ